MPNLKDLVGSLTKSGDNSKSLLKFNIPNSQIVKEEGFPSQTVGELAKSVVKTVGDINQIANTVYCIGMAITNPEMLLNVLDMIAGQIMAVVMDMVERVLSVLEGQIMQMFNTIAGTILNVFNAILAVLNAILDVYDALCKIYDALTKSGSDTWHKFLSKEDCEFMLASMALCILNKLFGDKLAKFERELTSEITEWGQKVNTKLTKELADTNSMANFVQHESFMVSKSAKQLGGMFS